MRHARPAARSLGRTPLPGFSLVELVMVVFIVAVIAAIAVPRVAQASRNAQATAIFGTIANVRQGIDYYQAEHGKYPGYNPANGSPSGTWFVDQLTLWSNTAGQTSPQPANQYWYGPYLRKPFPNNPLNKLTTVAIRARHSQAVAANGTGWAGCLEDGCFIVNSSDSDLTRLSIDRSDLIQLGGMDVGDLTATEVSPADTGGTTITGRSGGSIAVSEDGG